MKVLNVCLLLIVTLLMFRPVVAQNNAEPMTFSQFKEQKDLQIDFDHDTSGAGIFGFSFRSLRSCPVFDREKQSGSSDS